MTRHQQGPATPHSQLAESDSSGPLAASAADPGNPEGGTRLNLTQVTERGRIHRLQVLSDAVAYRRSRLAAPCWECRSAGPGRRCEEHSADLRLLATYLRDIRRASLVLGPSAHASVHAS